jgi:hypothetical protein
MTREPDLATALSNALAAISGQALSCEIDVPKATAGGTVDTSKVNVQYTPKEGDTPVQIPQDPSRPCNGGADGWQYEPGNDKIVVCGPTCDTVRAAHRIDIVLGCATVVR